MVLSSVLAAAPPAKKPAPVPLPDLNKAFWIWNDKGALAKGVMSCYFRRAVNLPAKPTSARVLVTADNGYEVFVNGSLVGGETGFDAGYWRSIEKYDIAHLLGAGRNVIAVRGINLGGPAGLVAAFRMDFAGHPPVELHTDRSWGFSVGSQTGWTHKAFDASKWPRAVELAGVGAGIWGKMSYPGPPSPTGSASRATIRFAEPSAEFRWPERVAFLTGRVGESSTRLPQCVWRIRGSRAYLEMDKLGPSVLGRQLHVLSPARPDAAATVLVSAEGGVIGSPSATYDGETILFAMARDGEKFIHLWAVPAGGGEPRRLTDGPVHDFDPAELPDGRIVFSSTRIGSREEYHGNSARSLFVMDADGRNIRPITHHIVGDNEPRITADGLIAFIRCDNFLERAKVETQIHVTRPDGTAGQVLLGADRYAIGYDGATAAEQNARWLRNYGYGSPAPLPDGRVACLSQHGLVISAGGVDPPTVVSSGMALFDIAPMPDGRLLCTTAGMGALAVLDLRTGRMVRLHARDTYDMHSPVYLGPRPRPPVIPSSIATGPGSPVRTGLLVCQNVFAGKQTKADLARIRAIRVYEGVALTNRSARHSYNHIGVEAVELGTAPIAADGSFCVEVPADRALAIQAIDGEGRSIINEMSWIYVRPGERRSCVGCHGARPAAPHTAGGLLAMQTPPVRLLGQGRPHRFRGNNAANGGVLNLQFDRFREVASIDLYGPPRPTKAPGKAGPGRSGDVAGLIRALGGTDAARRVSAARRLAIFRDRSAVEPLARVLAGGPRDLRIAAALALSACGDRRAIGPLVRALDDRAAAVAQAAHVALGNLTAHDEVFNGHAPVGARGADAWRQWLAAHDGRRIERDLIARLGDADAAARHRAIVALGHVGSGAGAEALRAMVRVSKPGHLRATLEALRALGRLKDTRAVGLLSEQLRLGIEACRKRAHDEMGRHQGPAYVAATAAEALGWIATSEAEHALVEAFAGLGDFWWYTHRTGDHSWLMGSHSSVVHFRILEALDAMGSTEGRRIATAALKAIPIDSDRGLLYENDAYENVTARVIARAQLAGEIAEACLGVLGDPVAANAKRWRAAVTASPPASSTGALCAESRAAQVLSIVCRDAALAGRIRVVYERFRAQKPSRKRSWTCFLLARTLGKLRDRGSVDALASSLTDDATEASFGRPAPPNVFVHNAMTPCYRGAAADALGRIGDRRAGPSLLAAVANFENAMDVRHAAARALEMLADARHVDRLRALARDYPEITTRRVLARACERASAAKK